VQNYSIEIFPRFFSSAGAVAGTFASDALIGRDPQFWMTYRGRVRAVTPADVRRAAGAYIDPARLVILIVGNVDEILAGNPDRPDFSVERLAGGRPIVRIPLPDPMTMVYPDIQ
jgi:zinc protease